MITVISKILICSSPTARDWLITIFALESDSPDKALQRQNHFPKSKKANKSAKFVQACYRDPLDNGCTYLKYSTFSAMILEWLGVKIQKQSGLL